MKDKIKIKDTLYYAQIIPSLCHYNVLDMKVVDLYDTYFVCIEKSKEKIYPLNYTNIGKMIFENRFFLFNYTDIEKVIFEDKLKALRAIKKKEHNVKNQKNIIDDMIDYIINDRYKDYKNLILELEKVDLDVISNK